MLSMDSPARLGLIFFANVKFVVILQKQWIKKCSCSRLKIDKTAAFLL